MSNAEHFTKEQERVAEGLGHAVMAVVDEALSMGYVITVELVPDMPLAMGNYHSNVTVRKRREMASPDA